MSPTPNSDLAQLITLCHRHKIRFFCDMVMAFATQYSYRNINFLDFHVQAGAGDPGEYTLDGNGNRIKRDSFGGDLFKYNYEAYGYDPLSGENKTQFFARSLMQSYLARWMRDFRVDGLRLDSVVNYGSWDFMQQFKDTARQLWRDRAAAQNLTGGSADERFITVGEELAVPIDILRQNRLDGLWNENFKRMVRYAILGQNDEKEPSFEWTVRKLIDCRLLGFADGTQAVNYVTSHDVEGYRNERLYNFLVNNKATVLEKRIRLAFVCLLTAVGIPMIFAGEEFADQHDLVVLHPMKQVDPVNFERCEESWRQEIFQYVSRLVKLRTSHDALAVNDTDFIHVDFNDNKRVLVWQRGIAASGNVIVVVANFSDFETQNADSGGEYIIPTFPQAPAGKQWYEVTQHRMVASPWAGRRCTSWSKPYIDTRRLKE
jgi:1,4-alpha-glucan branching enzyme